MNELEQQNLNKVSTFFEQIIFFNNIYKKYKYETEKVTSNRFNIFKYIWIDENIMSDIIAEMLNHAGEHGQGGLFLKLLCETLEITSINKDRHPVSVEREVRTRQHTKNLRRMDILIDWIDFGIMIENKPRPKDQENQLINYCEDLQNKYGEEKFILIYLSKQEYLPSESSLPKKKKIELESKKQFIHMDYQNKFSDWINRCINNCQSEKYKWFLKDFLNHILNNYL